MEIGSAIEPVLRIDAYTASGSRGSYARLCVQVDLEKPLINMIRIGKCKQAVYMREFLLFASAVDVLVILGINVATVLDKKR